MAIDTKAVRRKCENPLRAYFEFHRSEIYALCEALDQQTAELEALKRQVTFLTGQLDRKNERLRNLGQDVGGTPR